MITLFELIDPFEYTKKAYFKVRTKNDEYDVNIVIEDGKAIYNATSCTCVFGSYYSQTKENQKSGKICCHLKECLAFLEREYWIENGE